MILVFLLYAMFASVFIIEKTCLLYTQPLFLVGSRMFFAGSLMLLYCLLQSQWKIHKEDLWKVIFLAFFNIYLTNVLEVFALTQMTAFKTCFIYSLSPFIAALFSFFIFAEKLSKKKWQGLLFGIAGTIPILLEKNLQAKNSFFISWPEIAMIGAVFSSVYGWILLKQLVVKNSSFLANGYSMFFGGVFSLTHSLFFENWNPVPVNNFFNFSIGFILLILVSNITCYNLYGYLLKRFSATLMSFAGFTTPLFTAIFGWIYLGEQVTLSFLCSFVLVFIGLIIFSKEELLRYKTLAVKS